MWVAIKTGSKTLKNSLWSKNRPAYFAKMPEIAAAKVSGCSADKRTFQYHKFSRSLLAGKAIPIFNHG